MNRKIIIIFIVLLGIASLAFMFWTARNARRTSNDILEEFKKVDKSLDSTNKDLQKKNDSSALYIKK